MDLADVVIEKTAADHPATQVKQPRSSSLEHIPPSKEHINHQPDHSLPNSLPNSLPDSAVDLAVPLKQKKKMDLLSNIYFASFLLILAGAFLALQAGCNGKLGKVAGGAFSAVFSFGTGFICVAIYCAIDVLAIKSPAPDLARIFTTSPWWAFVGGALGAYFVVVNILLVPRLGAGTVLSVFVCSQIITACLIDHFGLVGVPQRNFTVWRGLGSVAMVGGVIAVTLF